MYEVFGWGSPHRYTDLNEAVERARAIAKQITTQAPAIIRDIGRQLIIGVVTDDANGVTLHKLATWPE